MNLATETVLPGADALSAHPPLAPAELAPHFPHLEILECLGRGGMGVVYKARQRSLNRLVALKLLAPERVQDAKFAARFSHEAQALAALNHPNIVTVHDFGQAGGFYFLLMEFVDGVYLRQLLRARRLGPAEALAVVPPICEALQYAHEHGIVHRDIKPENLLLDKNGRVKIADFGIAKMLGTGTSGIGVAESQPAGTPQYMAPEQLAEPEKGDHRADIYSLGVVLYEMLTGELPPSLPQPPSRKVQIDVRLDEIVLRALEKTPALRYQTAADFRTQIETVVNDSGAPIKPDSRASKATATAHRGMFPVVVGALLAILLVVIVGMSVVFFGYQAARANNAAAQRAKAEAAANAQANLEDLGRQRTASARLKLAHAKAELERLTKLNADNLVSQQELDQAKFMLELARAEITGDDEKANRVRLQQAEAQLERVLKLHADSLVSQSDVNKARFGVERAKAELAGDAVEMLRVGLKEAEDDFARASELRKQNFISESEYNKSKLALELAQAELASARPRKTAP